MKVEPNGLDGALAELRTCQAEPNALQRPDLVREHLTATHLPVIATARLPYMQHKSAEKQSLPYRRRDDGTPVAVAAPDLPQLLDRDGLQLGR